MLSPILALLVLASIALASPAADRPAHPILRSDDHFLNARQYNGLSAYARVSGAGVGHSNVYGNFSFITGSNGVVSVSGIVNGLNTINGTGTSTKLPPPPTGFLYHIHTNPIPPSGDCNAALGHLDPLAVGEVLACGPNNAAYCQLGDLAGKHGKLPANMSTVAVNYEDAYLRFSPQDFSLLGRSVVIHMPVYPNLTRIACGNITSLLDGTGSGTGSTPTNKSSNYITMYPAAVGPEPTSYAIAFPSSSTDSSALGAYTSTVSPLPQSLLPVTVAPNVALASTEVPFNGSSVYAYEAVSTSASSPSGSITAAAQLPSQNQIVPPFTGNMTQATANPTPSGGGGGGGGQGSMSTSASGGGSSSVPSSAAAPNFQAGSGHGAVLMGMVLSVALSAVLGAMTVL